MIFGKIKNSEPAKEPRLAAEVKETEAGNIETAPSIRYKILRHAERTPSGELTPDGLNLAGEKGRELSDSAEIVKGYTSQEKSDRTYATVDKISEMSETESPLTEKQYATRRRPGLYYDLSGPLMPRVQEYTKAINEAVKRDYPEFEPDSKDPQWGKIRKEYQPLALNKMIAEDGELVHIFAMGAAHQLQEMMDISSRYVDYRQTKAAQDGEAAIKKDLVPIEGTHGGFPESLLKNVLIRVNSSTGQEKVGFSTYTDEKGNPALENALGGLFKPGEGFEAEQKIGQPLADRLPLTFEDAHRFPGEKCFIDLNRLKDLADQFNIYFEKLQAWQKDKSLSEDLLACLAELKNNFAKKYEGQGN